MADDAAQQTRIALHEECKGLLVQRLRAGLWLVLFTVALFAATDSQIGAERLPIVFWVRLLQTLIVAAAYVALRRPASWRRAVTIGVVFEGAICFATVIPGVVFQEVRTAVLLFIILSMATGALLPWGAGPQLVSVAAACLALAWTVYAAGGLAATADYQMIACIVAFVTSVYVAYQLDRSRLQRTQAERTLEERATIEFLRADVRVALSERVTLRVNLQLCADALLRHLDAAVARIWTLDDGGILEIQATAGLRTETDGALPVGAPEVAFIARQRTAYLTNDLPNDPLLAEAAGASWARCDGIVAFAGYPLVIDDRLVGVMAILSRRRLTGAALAALSAEADAIAAHIDRKRADDAARNSEADKGAILAAALDCIVTIDHEGRITEFNPAAEHTFGYRRSDVIGKAMADVIVPPALRAAHRAGFKRYLATGEEVVLGKRIEIDAMRADGTEFPVELAITRIRRDGPPLFTGYLRDITDRKRGEDALALSKTRLEEEAGISAALARVAQEMISSLDQPVILDRLCRLTTEGLACDCSHTFLWEPQEQAFVLAAGHGDPPEQWAALRELRVPRAMMDRLLAHLEQAQVAQVSSAAPGLLPVELLAGCAITVGMYTLLRGRGEQRVGIHSAGYRGRTERFTEAQERIASGIAQVGSMALANARLVEEIGRAARLKSEFVSTMSHELRAPLNVILGYAEMLWDDTFDAPRRRDLVGRIEASGRGLLELIENTLEIGRIDADRQDVRLESVPLPVFWTALGEQCGRLPRRNEVELEWNQSVPEVALETDPRKLSTVCGTSSAMRSSSQNAGGYGRTCG